VIGPGDHSGQGHSSQIITVPVLLQLANEFGAMGMQAGKDVLVVRYSCLDF
jgi:hypothetical protein